MLFKDALDGYWLEKRRDFSRHTINDYQLTFRRLQEYVGPEAHIEHINTGVIRAFLNHLLDEYELSEKTLCNAWTALSSLWTWAEVDLNIAHVIRGRVKRPKYRHPPIETYSQVEAQAMLNACDHADDWTTKRGKQISRRRPTALCDRAMIITLLDTGLRASELCSLTLADFNRESGQITVRQGKGKKNRIVFISDAARRSLWKYLTTRPKSKATDPLFATQTNQHLDRNNLRHTLQRIASHAGVAKATVHRFRHTFAVNFSRNKGSVVALQELLGHERLETIPIYVKLADVDLANEQHAASPSDNWRLK
jgi:integrase/recombinase XerD